jgi:hypothetical protein
MRDYERETWYFHVLLFCIAQKTDWQNDVAHLKSGFSWNQGAVLFHGVNFGRVKQDWRRQGNYHSDGVARV